MGKARANRNGKACIDIDALASLELVQRHLSRKLAKQPLNEKSLSFNVSRCFRFLMAAINSLVTVPMQLRHGTGTFKAALL
jgi:hypothetical protein